MSIIRHFNGSETDLSWEDVPIRKYNDEFVGVTRQIPVGPDEGSNNFHIRYFRCEPGTHTNKESHPHEHGVIVVHGHARLQLNDEFFDVKPHDAIFISGNDVHQFVVQGDEPFGFICVVVGKR
jgi:quercetin dioxygenase-like cupin family protein